MLELSDREFAGEHGVKVVNSSNEDAFAKVSFYLPNSPPQR